MLRKLLAVLVVTAVVLTAVPVQAAPAAEDRGALLRLTDWFAGLVEGLAVLVDASEAGPEMDPNGTPLLDDSATQTESGSDDPLDTTTEAGPEMDPNG